MNITFEKIVEKIEEDYESRYILAYGLEDDVVWFRTDNSPGTVVRVFKSGEYHVECDDEHEDPSFLFFPSPLKSWIVMYCADNNREGYQND